MCSSIHSVFLFRTTCPFTKRIRHKMHKFIRRVAFQRLLMHNYLKLEQLNNWSSLFLHKNTLSMHFFRWRFPSLILLVTHLRFLDDFFFRAMFSKKMACLPILSLVHFQVDGLTAWFVSRFRNFPSHIVMFDKTFDFKLCFNLFTTCEEVVDLSLV